MRHVPVVGIGPQPELDGPRRDRSPEQRLGHPVPFRAQPPAQLLDQEPVQPAQPLVRDTAPLQPPDPVEPDLEPSALGALPGPLCPYHS